MALASYQITSSPKQKPFLALLHLIGIEGALEDITFVSAFGNNYPYPRRVLGLKLPKAK